MPFRGSVRQVLPTKGIFNAVPIQQIPEGYCFDALNVRFDRAGIRQRNAYNKLNTADHTAGTSARVTGMAEMAYSGGTRRQFVVCGTKVSENTSGTSWTDRTGAITITSGRDIRFTFAALNDLLIASNGTDALFKLATASNAAALSGTPPTFAKAVMGFRNRILCGGVSGTNGLSAVQWCALNNPDSWTVAAGGGTATPVLSGSQTVTGLAAIANEAFLFYDSSIFRIVPLTDPKNAFGFPDHSPSIGACSKNAIVAVPEAGAIFFANDRGIYRMQAPGFQPELISFPVDAYWNQKQTLQNVDPSTAPIVRDASDRANITGGANPAFGEVWFTIKMSDASTQTLVYNYEQDWWTRFNGIVANAYGLFLDATTGKRFLVHGDRGASAAIATHQVTLTTGTTLSTDSDTGAISSSITSRAETLSDGTRRGAVRFIRLQTGIHAITGTDDLTITYSHDLVSRGISATASLVGTSEALGQKETLVNTTGDGRYFQYKLARSVGDVTFQLSGIELGVVPETAPK